MIFMKILKYSPNKKHRISIVFDDMIAVMLSNKKSSPIFTELFIRGAKINVSLSFVTQTCFAVPKKYLTKFYILFYMKVQNKQEMQQIAFNRSSDISFKEFMNLYKTEYLVIDTTATSDNALRFKKNVLKKI